MDQLAPFQTELFYAEYEFTCPHMLSASDCETLTVGELLQLAGVPVESFLLQHLGYTESMGDPALRDLVAARYARLTGEQVLILSAPIEGLFLVSQLFKGETIVLLPAYDALKNLPSNMKSWRLLPTEGDWALDFDALNELAGPKTELLVVNFPHNPTGFLPSPEEWSRLVEWARQRGVWLFCDEMYRGLGPLLTPVVDLYERSFVLGGLSKSQGLPGLRCGWLASQDQELVRRFHDLKLYTSICPPGPVENLARVALSIEDKLLERCNAIVSENLELADRFFQRWKSKFVWRRPRAGSIGLVELQGEGSAEALSRRWAGDHGVVLLPSSFLGFPDRYLRFGFGRRSFPKNLEALERVLLDS